QNQDICRLIYQELGQIEETVKSEYELAKKLQADFDNSLAKLISQSTETNQAQITLFTLDAAAKSYRRLYDNFLKRHTEAVQQQTFPITEARQISAASAIKTAPKTAQVWMVTVIAGGLIGAGLRGLREITDRRFGSREHVQSVLGAMCLALGPLVD